MRTREAQENFTKVSYAFKQLEECKEELAKTRETLQKKISQLAEATFQNEELKKKLEEIPNESNSLKTIVSDLRKSLVNANEALKKQQKIEEELSSKEIELDLAKLKLSEASKKLQASKATKKERKSSNLKLQEKLEELNKQIGQMKDENREIKMHYKTKIKRNKMEGSEKQKRLQEINTKLKKVQNKKKTLKRLLKEAHEELSETKKGLMVYSKVGQVLEKSAARDLEIRRALEGSSKGDVAVYGEKAADSNRINLERLGVNSIPNSQVVRKPDGSEGGGVMHGRMEESEIRGSHLGEPNEKEKNARNKEMMDSLNHINEAREPVAEGSWISSASAIRGLPYSRLQQLKFEKGIVRVYFSKPFFTDHLTEAERTSYCDFVLKQKGLLVSTNSIQVSVSINIANSSIVHSKGRIGSHYNSILMQIHFEFLDKTKEINRFETKFLGNSSLVCNQKPRNPPTTLRPGEKFTHSLLIDFASFPFKLIEMEFVYSYFSLCCFELALKELIESEHQTTSPTTKCFCRSVPWAS